MDSFKSKILKGVFWNSLVQFGTQGINFIVFLILARMLTPADFGLLGMVTVITGFMGYFSELGLIQSLIRKTKIEDIDCYTAFWGGLSFSIIVYTLLFTLAPIISLFYGQPELTVITRVVSLVFPIGALTYVPAALEVKKMRYDRLTKINLVSLVIAGIISVTLAVLGFGIWSLVIQQIVFRACEVSGVLIVTKFRPKFRFSLTHFMELVSYGKHVMLYNFVKFFSENIDYLLIGKLLGAGSLGIYTIAFRISKYPVEKLWQVLARILFPAFSAIQEDKEKLIKIYYEVSAAGLLVTVPILSIIFFGTQEFIEITVGSKWNEAIPFIKILVWYLVLMSMSVGDESILMLKNIRKLNLVKILSSLIFVLAAFAVVGRFGLIGIAIAYTTIFSIYWLIIKLIAIVSLKQSPIDFFKKCRKLFHYIVVTFGTAFVVSYYQPSNSAIISMATLAVSTLLLSLSILFFYNAIQWRYPFLIVEKMFNTGTRN